ncbi:MAG: uridine kinase [Coxiella sp. (in: Bacteria)]|nr:MAG: uridine kinase [Coxiella sp. (in: g-proteobacteria)]
MKETIIIGIAGASASGKSVLARNLLSELGSDQVIVISEDAYYKDLSHQSLEERAKTNFDHPDSLDHELMMTDLQRLQKGNAVDIPKYDFSKHLRMHETRHIAKHRIIVLEGILLFVEKELRELMDIRIFMDSPQDICLIRRLRRDIIQRGRSLDCVLEQYQKTVRPMYYQFVEPSKRYADIIVPRGGENRIAVDMILAKMRELLVQ